MSDFFLALRIFCSLRSHGASTFSFTIEPQNSLSGPVLVSSLSLSSFLLCCLFLSFYNTTSAVKIKDLLTNF